MVSSDGGLSPGLYVGPSPHVLVFLLHPAKLRVAVLVGHLLHDVEGEGGDLLDGVDGNLVLQAGLPPRLDQVVVDLAGTEQDLLHAGRVLSGGPVVQDHPLELGSRKQVVEARLALGVPQQRLGRHHDQRLPKRQCGLTAEDVEVVGGVGAVGYDHVDVAELLDGELVLLRWEVLGVVGTQLQESFRAGGAVLRAHTYTQTVETEKHK